MRFRDKKCNPVASFFLFRVQSYENLGVEQNKFIYFFTFRLRNDIVTRFPWPNWAFGVILQRKSDLFGLVRQLLDEADDKKFAEIFADIGRQEDLTDRVEIEIARYLEQVGMGHQQPRLRLRPRHDVCRCGQRMRKTRRLRRECRRSALWEINTLEFCPFICKFARENGKETNIGG